MGEWRYTSTILDLGTGWRSGGHPHASSDLLLVKKHTVPIGYEAVWPPKSIWMLWSREKGLPGI
jgi:hypothetical protein